MATLRRSYRSSADDRDRGTPSPNKKLAALAKRDDAALFALIERDVRFVFTELVQLRVLEWMALRRRDQFHGPMTHERRNAIATRAGEAEGKLRRLATAFLRVGEASVVPLETFANAFIGVHHAIQKARKSKLDVPAIAKRYELEINTVFALKKDSKRPAVLDAIVAELAWRYSVSQSSIRRHYDRAVDFGLLERVVGRRSKKGS